MTFGLDPKQVVPYEELLIPQKKVDLVMHLIYVLMKGEKYEKCSI